MQDDLSLSASASSPSGDAAEHSEDRSRSGPDLGDLVIILLASTLAGLRDRLADDGFDRASQFAAELTERCDSYLEEVGT